MYTHVLYHGNCPDGFGAAYVAWHVLGDSAKYIPVQYSEAPPELPLDARVLIVDFSYKRSVLEELKFKVQSLVVLDHHKTAQSDLDGLDYCLFNMNKSGAVLAWEHFHPGEEHRPLNLYLQDRDLWQWKLENSHEISAAILSYPFDFQIWQNQFEYPDLARMIVEGGAILRAKNQQIELNMQNYFITVVDGKEVPVVNINVHISETLNSLCKKFPEYPFAAAYFDHPNGRRKWSLRSIGDNDVAIICAKFGGGGHKNAAGFEEIPPYNSVLHV